MKHCHSREVLVLLGTLLTRQVLELLVLLGFPEWMTEMEKTDDREQKVQLVFMSGTKWCWE